MSKKTPLVSVSMIVYHAENFISDAIEGVLRQKVDFPIELVIGDDCSKDNTRNICETYAQKHPNLIRIMPLEANMGIAANTARTMGSCQGKYIAVCDGDDIWTDPLKLKRQVDFLEKNPDYGVVYTDVETISETGEPTPDPEQESIREMYAQGDVFVKLLQANFINNSTAVFRRDLIADLNIHTGRIYQIPDHIRWLHVASCSKVRFMDFKSTQYRKHTSGLSVTVPPAIVRGNRRILRHSLYQIIPKFDRCNSQPLSRDERIVLFRRMMSLLLRGPGSLRLRLRILSIMPGYFPGMADLFRIFLKKIVQAFSFHKFFSHLFFKEINA